MSVIASFQNALVVGRVGCQLSKKIARLVDRLGSGPHLGGWIGSGVWVRASFHIFT